MSIFNVVNDAVVMDTSGVLPPIDIYQNGLRVDGVTGNVHVVPSGGQVFNQGLLMTHEGQFQYVDSTAGLPANVAWTNGIPHSSRAICISTGPLATYSNGVPFTQNGAIRAQLIP